MATMATMTIRRRLQPLMGKRWHGCVLAIGNFDGCHVGHRALLAMARAEADRLGVDSPLAALTFEPHPLQVLRPGLQVRRLGGVRDKVLGLASCGVSVLYLARFDRVMAETKAEDFCRLLFDDRQGIGAKVVVVGEDFRFGYGRRGDVGMLQSIGQGYGAKVRGVGLVEMSGGVVSSGRIRAAIADGKFAVAEELLGRPWLINGRVVHGKGLGNSLGFATANVNAGFVPPCRGIFAAMVMGVGGVGIVEGKNPPEEFIYRAAVSIGTNPTIDGGGGVSVEAHLIDFDGDLYGRRLSLKLCRKLRDEREYPDLDALRDAIADDVRQVRGVLPL